MIILGINAYHGDASAVLLCDGELVGAVEEERFQRIKHIAGFPYNAVRWLIKSSGIKPEEIDHIAISRNPSAHIHKKILFTLSKLPSFSLLKDRLSNVMRIKDIKVEVAKALGVDPKRVKAQIHNVEHHKAHLASSFFVSGFDRAAILSVDGFGDFVSGMWGKGKGNRIDVEGWVEFPHSLGLAYTAFTQYLGFLKYGDEYKVMGLAPYGEPSYLDEFRKIINVDKDRMGYKLDLSYFVHHTEGVTMTWEEGPPILSNAYSDKLIERFGPPRKPWTEIDKHYKDIAASLQTRLEEAMFNLLNELYELYKLPKLCMAGGVALNCVVNGKIFKKTPFEELYVQPASHDGGTSLGAAYYVYHQILGKPRKFVMRHVYWGPEFSEQEIVKSLKIRGEKLESCKVERLESEDELCKKVARYIAEGRIVGWFQGKAEWGPRALGNRSIIVDPRKKEMKDILNQRIKHREPFRPFAPSILEKAVQDYFEETYPSPFMTMTYKVKPEKRQVIPAVTHVDGTGRLQTVNKEENPLYWKLIKEFEKITGIPVLLNTSFNENEPIVCTPDEALDCFLRTKMDMLVMGNWLLKRSQK